MKVKCKYCKTKFDPKDKYCPYCYARYRDTVTHVNEDGRFRPIKLSNTTLSNTTRESGFHQQSLWQSGAKKNKKTQYKMNGKKRKSPFQFFLMFIIVIYIIQFIFGIIFAIFG